MMLRHLHFSLRPRGSLFALEALLPCAALVRAVYGDFGGVGSLLHRPISRSFTAGRSKYAVHASVGAGQQDLRQYLASHMLNRERYPKRAPYKQQLHGQAYPRQTPSSLLGGGGSVRCTCISHAKHRCRKPPADHQRRTHALGPCQQRNRANHPPRPHLYSAAQLPNAQSLLPKQGLSFVKQPAPSCTNQRRRR